MEEVNSYVQATRVINQQLWCCCYYGGIVVFDTELNQQRTYDMCRVYDVAQMSNGDVIIATFNGLYHAEITGEAQFWAHHAPNSVAQRPQL